jgi:hypothetical protein
VGIPLSVFSSAVVPPLIHDDSSDTVRLVPVAVWMLLTVSVTQ